MVGVITVLFDQRNNGQLPTLARVLFEVLSEIGLDGIVGMKKKEKKKRIAASP